MNEKLITSAELAEELKVPLSWVYSRTRQRGPDVIPMIRVGRYIRYRLPEVLDWLVRKDKEGSNA